LATRAYAKEAIDLRTADGRVRQVRDYPRLKFGGAHLGDDEARRDADIAQRLLRALALAAAIRCALAGVAVAALARAGNCTLLAAWRCIWRGQTEFAWNAVLIALACVLACALSLAGLADDYHVFGTDKVGQDVL